MMNWIVFTPAQAAEVLAENEASEYWIKPRLIDNPAHARAGDSVAPQRVAEGEYAPYWAEHLADHDRMTAAPDELFLPQEDI